MSDAPARQLSLSGCGACAYTPQVLEPGWGARCAVPQLRPANGCFNVACGGASLPKGWHFDFLVGWAGCEGLRLEPRGTPRCCSLGWGRAAGPAGTAPGTEELAAGRTGGGETEAQPREGCLQAMSCHFVSFKRVGFPLSWSSVRGGGSVSPCPAPPRLGREAARGGTGGPLGKAPINPSLPSPGALPATSALGARGLQAVQLICC